MADNYEFEEEEFNTQFNGGTLRRVLGLLRPHWKWVAGFLVTIAITAFLDSIFTLLSKRMVDEAIIPGNKAILYQTVAIYVGPATVTTSTGIKVESGASIDMPTTKLIQGITAAAYTAAGEDDKTHYVEFHD